MSFDRFSPESFEDYRNRNKSQREIDLARSEESHDDEADALMFRPEPQEDAT